MEHQRVHQDSAAKKLPYVLVEPYDPKEETTYVEEAILLNSSCVKQWLLTPLLSIVTVFIWPLVLYWKVGVRRDYLYSRATSVATATHCFIQGKGKSPLRSFTVFEFRWQPRNRARP